MSTYNEAWPCRWLHKFWPQHKVQKNGTRSGSHNLQNIVRKPLKLVEHLDPQSKTIQDIKLHYLDLFDRLYRNLQAIDKGRKRTEEARTERDELQIRVADWTMLALRCQERDMGPDFEDVIPAGRRNVEQTQRRLEEQNNILQRLDYDVAQRVAKQREVWQQVYRHAWTYFDACLNAGFSRREVLSHSGCSGIRVLHDRKSFLAHKEQELEWLKHRMRSAKVETWRSQRAHTENSAVGRRLKAARLKACKEVEDGVALQMERLQRHIDALRQSCESSEEELIENEILPLLIKAGRVQKDTAGVEDTSNDGNNDIRDGDNHEDEQDDFSMSGSSESSSTSNESSESDDVAENVRAQRQYGKARLELEKLQTKFRKKQTYYRAKQIDHLIIFRKSNADIFERLVASWLDKKYGGRLRYLEKSLVDMREYMVQENIEVPRSPSVAHCLPDGRSRDGRSLRSDSVSEGRVSKQKGVSKGGGSAAMRRRRMNDWRLSGLHGAADTRKTPPADVDVDHLSDVESVHSPS